MLLATVVACSDAVASTRSRNRKSAALAGLLRETPDALLPVVVAWLSGDLPQGRIGVGYATVAAARDATTAAEAPSLEVDGLHRAFTEIADYAGKGSGTARRERLEGLLTQATEPERAFLVALLTGELRQGALAGVMTDAFAASEDIDPAVVRRAAMLAGDLPEVARIAREEGAAGLAALRVELGTALQPMLADTAEDVAEALDKHGGAARFDWKIDGARVQVHRDGERVRVFSRRMNEVTAAVPEVVELARALSEPRFILDGEVIALRRDGRPHPFQTTMRRFGRKTRGSAAELREELPLTPLFFDLVRLGDDDVLDRPLTERMALLERLVPAASRVPGQVIESAAAGEAFLEQALQAGHEGVMAKGLHTPWEAGKRGSDWLKLKPAWTLDLVVLAAEWGSGRRSGWLSNLHLGARSDDGWVMLGKTFKGLTDETLQWQTDELRARETARDKHVVRVRPELVVEIAFNEIQASPRYDGGLALRFARVKGYRPDKDPSEADTIETVRRIHEGQLTLLDAHRRARES